MRPFTYERPSDEGRAVAASQAPGARIIAGGTGVVDLMRLGVEAPEALIDVNALAWSTIESTPEGGLRIGALVKNTELAYHPDVRVRYPMLAEAVLAGASPQIRNMASVGGNLVQRTRCAYFRDPGVTSCNKRAPGSGCAAIGGYTRMHAVLGGSAGCIAVHPSDMCVALAALDPIIHVRGPAGARTIEFANFHLVPGERPELETVLAKGDLVTSVELPSLPWAVRSAYVKVRDRASYAFALAAAAVALDLRGGTIKEARIALGGVATKPWRSRDAEASLRGRPAARATYERAAEIALEGAVPRGDNAFKIALAKRTIVRALERAGAMT